MEEGERLVVDSELIGEKTCRRAVDTYYNQRVLEDAYNDPVADFPNAIYIDAVDLGGAIRTGTHLINPLTKVSGLLPLGLCAISVSVFFCRPVLAGCRFSSGLKSRIAQSL